MHVLRTAHRVAVACAGPGWPDRAHDAISTSTSDASDGPPAARPPEPNKNIFTHTLGTASPRVESVFSSVNEECLQLGT